MSQTWLQPCDRLRWTANQNDYWVKGFQNFREGLVYVLSQGVGGGGSSIQFGPHDLNFGYHKI